MGQGPCLELPGGYRAHVTEGLQEIRETAEALDLFPLAHDARALDDASLIGETLENFSLSVDVID